MLSITSRSAQAVVDVIVVGIVAAIGRMVVVISFISIIRLVNNIGKVSLVCASFSWWPAVLLSLRTTTYGNGWVTCSTDSSSLMTVMYESGGGGLAGDGVHSAVTAIRFLDRCTDELM